MVQLSLSACKTRQQRFLKSLAESRVDAALITDVRDIFYFTGKLLPNDLPAMLILESDGTASCVAPADQEVAGVDRYIPYEWQHRGTHHPDPPPRMLNEFNATVDQSKWQRVGVQMASLPLDMLQSLSSASLHRIDYSLAEMQRRKDPDEIEVIRASIDINMAAYEAVAEAIRTGANELDILSAGRAGAMRAAREKVFHDGDYQCGSYNGPARDRSIEQGELYIVDAWTHYHGYWCDMSRTFVVGASDRHPATAVRSHPLGAARGRQAATAWP